MIKAKLKKCAGCEQMKHIWKSHGKEKYCKECWYSIDKPKSISPVSKKRQVEMDGYSKLREAFLLAKPHCEAKLVGCTSKSTDVHHKTGRVGENYLKIGTWLSTCRNCHKWIEENPEAAKELGFSESRLNNSKDESSLSS
jgi:hypothetical protein